MSLGKKQVCKITGGGAMAGIAVNGLGRAGRAALKITGQADGAGVVALPSPDLSQIRP